MDQSFVALRTGNPGKLKPPVPGYRESLPPAGAGDARAHAPGQCGRLARDGARALSRAFVERTQADELIVAGATFDPAARRRSLAADHGSTAKPLTRGCNAGSAGLP